MNTTPIGIGEPKTLPTDALNTYTGNPRRGDIAAIRESLESNGQFRPIVVNTGTHTGRENEVLAGNHTLMAARELGWETIDCYVVDVDHDHAAKIVLADNRTGDLAEYDDRILLDLLRTLETTDGTGYDDDDVADLAALEEEQRAQLAETQPDTQPDAPNPTGEHTGPANTPEEPTGAEATRMFAVHFPLEQFVWVQEALDKWHNDHPEAGGAHSVAVQTLLTQATT